MAWTQRQRLEHSELMKNIALFRKCQGCARENATTLRRDPKTTWAVCRYCGHEAVMARYSASAEEYAKRMGRY